VDAAERSADKLPWHPVPDWAPPGDRVVRDVADVWHSLDAALADVGAACRACGRCCDFPTRGHVLFAAAVELAPAISWAWAHGVVSRATAESRLSRGLCPFWSDGRCDVHPVRPVGCRAYFCDPRAAESGARVSEIALQQLSALCRDHGQRWWYGPALAYFAHNLADPKQFT
jgi:Fe-S-cluster containining protein